MVRPLQRQERRAKLEATTNRANHVVDVQTHDPQEPDAPRVVPARVTAIGAARRRFVATIHGRRMIERRRFHLRLRRGVLVVLLAIVEAMGPPMEIARPNRFVRRCEGRSLCRRSRLARDCRGPRRCLAGHRRRGFADGDLGNGNGRLVRVQSLGRVRSLLLRRAARLVRREACAIGDFGDRSSIRWVVIRNGHRWRRLRRSGDGRGVDLLRRRREGPADAAEVVAGWLGDGDGIGRSESGLEGEIVVVVFVFVGGAGEA